MDRIKTLVIYGDSISELTCGRGGYTVPLKEYLGAETMYNHAISASALTRGTFRSTSELLDHKENLHADADIVVLWHGTNDWYWGAEPGDADSSDDTTFCGAIRRAVNVIRDCAPAAKIFIPTPFFRWQNPDGCETVGEAFENPNKIGFTQKAYYDSIFLMSKILSFDVIDLRTKTGFCKQTVPLYQPDNVHPNAAGCEIIAKILYNHIQLSY